MSIKAYSQTATIFNDYQFVFCYLILINVNAVDSDFEYDDSVMVVCIDLCKAYDVVNIIAVHIVHICTTSLCML